MEVSMKLPNQEYPSTSGLFPWCFERCWVAFAHRPSALARSRWRVFARATSAICALIFGTVRGSCRRFTGAVVAVQSGSCRRYTWAVLHCRTVSRLLLPSYCPATTATLFASTTASSHSHYFYSRDLRRSSPCENPPTTPS